MIHGTNYTTVGPPLSEHLCASSIIKVFVPVCEFVTYMQSLILIEYSNRTHTTLIEHSSVVKIL